MVTVLNVMVGVGGEKYVGLGKLFYLFIKLLQIFTDTPNQTIQLVGMHQAPLNFINFARVKNVKKVDHFLFALLFISFAFCAQNPS